MAATVKKYVKRWKKDFFKKVKREKKLRYFSLVAINYWFSCIFSLQLSLLFTGVYLIFMYIFIYIVDPLNQF